METEVTLLLSLFRIMPWYTYSAPHYKPSLCNRGMSDGPCALLKPGVCYRNHPQHGPITESPGMTCPDRITWHNANSRYMATATLTRICYS